VEKTGERIPCLLNPSSVIVRRRAGVRVRNSTSGPLAGAALKDDPVLYTGGGMTEILLDLLFDVTLAGSSVAAEDVRDLTRPLSELAEGSLGDDGNAQVPLVRFVWGKAWNVLGVVTAVAERLEYFTSAGAPQRSWLRMRFLRTGDSARGVPSLQEETLLPKVAAELNVPPDQLRFHKLLGTGEDGGANGGSGTERLDEIAASRYGNPGWWRLIAVFNNIDNPWELPAGRLLAIPPVSGAGTTS
jgi:hypothetical protein